MGALAADGVDAEEAVELVLGAQGGDGDVWVAHSHQLVLGRQRLPPLAAENQEDDETRDSQD